MAAITIIPFRDDLAAAFARLNQAWIERFFRLEPSDLKTLRDPQGIRGRERRVKPGPSGWHVVSEPFGLERRVLSDHRGGSQLRLDMP